MKRQDLRYLMSSLFCRLKNLLSSTLGRSCIGSDFLKASRARTYEPAQERQLTVCNKLNTGWGAKHTMILWKIGDLAMTEQRDVLHPLQGLNMGTMVDEYSDAPLEATFLDPSLLEAASFAVMCAWSDNGQCRACHVACYESYLPLSVKHWI